MRLGLTATAFTALTASVLCLLPGCPSPEAKDTRYPPRPDGCDVTVYPEAPVAAIDNIGPVTASCGQDVTDDDCMRTLKDQACKLGADVVWGVEDPRMDLGKKKLAGRAAHTKQARARK